MVKQKTRKEFEAWANKELAKIQDRLFLGIYDLKPIKPSKNDDFSFHYSRFPYKDIYITYSEHIFTEWSKGNKQEAFATLVHEMCHTLMDGLMVKARSRFVTEAEVIAELEVLTDSITNILIKNGVFK